MGAGGSSGEISGVRVFRVHPGSPAAEAGLEVFFDIVLEVNGVSMDADNQSAFGEKIKACENGVVKLTVYSCRAHTTREAVVMPRAWAGTGILGATVRYDTVDPTECNGIRVLEVFPNSPAAHAGLVPFQDFMLGTGTAIFHDIDELVEQVQGHMNKKMSLYTYNSDSETVREIALVPNNDWGGDGCMGCDIGTGLLHRIPAARRPPGGAAAAAVATAPVAPPPTGVALPSGVALPPPGAVLPPPGAPSTTGLPASAMYPPGVAPPPTALPSTAPDGATGAAGPGDSEPSMPGPPAEAPSAVVPQGPPPLVAAGAPAQAPLSQEGVAKLQAQLQQLGQPEQAPAMPPTEAPAPVPVL